MSEKLLQFKGYLEQINKEEKTVNTTPKKILEYFNASKRGWKIIETVETMMQEHNVICEPDFRNAWVYGELKLSPKPKMKANGDKEKPFDKDPTPRISLLDAANMVDNGDINSELSKLIYVSRDTKIEEAITLMIYHDYSQLPILNGSKNIVGLISWKSYGKAIGLGKKCVTVNDCKEDPVVLKYDEPLFEAVKSIQRHEVVIIQKNDKSISGIVTSTDISAQFITLAEPFLIIEQIENYLRQLLHNKYTIDELNKFIKNEEEREIKFLSDLTFGQYILIIENQSLFDRLELKVDRIVVKEKLELIRRIRNDVMHFSPEGITIEKIEILRKTAHFFYILSNTLNLN